MDGRSKIDIYMSSMSELDRLILLRDSVNSCIRDKRSQIKAVERERLSGFNRVGIRGGIHTTISAKAQQATSVYLKNIELIKEISIYIE